MSTEAPVTVSCVRRSPVSAVSVTAPSARTAPLVTISSAVTSIVAPEAVVAVASSPAVVALPDFASIRTEPVVVPEDVKSSLIVKSPVRALIVAESVATTLPVRSIDPPVMLTSVPEISLVMSVASSVTDVSPFTSPSRSISLAVISVVVVASTPWTLALPRRASMRIEPVDVMSSLSVASPVVA